MSAQIKLDKESLKDEVKRLQFLQDDEEENAEQLKLFVFKNKNLEPEDFTFKELQNSDPKEKPLNDSDGKLTWKIEEGKIDFTASINGATGTIYYCEKNKKFVLDLKNECKEDSGKDDSTYKNITEIPIPDFTISDFKRADSPRNRYLVIDGSRKINYRVNNTMYKRIDPKGFEPTQKFDEIFEEASLDVKGTLSVFITNFNDMELESITVKLNGTDYSYAKGLQELYDEVKPKKQEDEEKNKDDESIDAQSTGDEKVLNYLMEAYNTINKNIVLDSDDLEVLNEYKGDLRNTKKNLSTKEQKYYSKIQSWIPKGLMITPYAKKIPDFDEISISIETKKTDEKTNRVNEIGDFRTTGGLSFNIGSNLNFTGLKLNEVYTETVDIDGVEELRAKIEERNQLSLGIGLNAEVGFRTGSIIEPTFNLGFFIPFEEDISPYLAIGPGFSLKTGKVRLAFSGGIAFGKVNSITERYNDTDLTDFNLTNTELTSSIWDTSWFVGIGINFVELTNSLSK